MLLLLFELEKLLEVGEERGGGVVERWENRSEPSCVTLRSVQSRIRLAIRAIGFPVPTWNDVNLAALLPLYCVCACLLTKPAKEVGGSAVHFKTLMMTMKRKRQDDGEGVGVAVKAEMLSGLEEEEGVG